MTETERAIEYLQPIADSATVGCYGEMLNIALSALRAQAERENPKSLTLDELRERNGKPVWFSECEKNWSIAEWVFFIKPEGGWIRFMRADGNALYRDCDKYGKTWLAYDYPPKEAQG